MNYGDGETQSYAFDPMGNRTSKSDTTTGTVTEGYTYNNANMLLTRGSNSYTNDSNGNTLTGGGRTNTWDGENRLTQCDYGGVTTTHTYGADGLRRRTVNGSNTTDHVLEGDNVVRTFLNSSVDKTYLHGARGPEYERTGSSSPLWYLYDGLGSVLGTVDSSGTVINTRKYDVYGGLRAGTGGSGPKHKFVGALGHPSEDDTGLIYMRARYCDPMTGRFNSEDPNREGNNWFSYVNSNPISNVDQNGKSTMGDALQACGIGAALGALGSTAFQFLLFGSVDFRLVFAAAFAGAITAASMPMIAAAIAAAGVPAGQQGIVLLVIRIISGNVGNTAAARQLYSDGRGPVTFAGVAILVHMTELYGTCDYLN